MDDIPGYGVGPGILSSGMNALALAYDASRDGNSLSTLIGDAKDMLGFGEIEDIYGDENWTRWLNQSRDDLVAEMTGLIPVTQVWFTAIGRTEYDLLPDGFLTISRLGYRDGPGTGEGEDVAWVPLYGRGDVNPYLSEPEPRTGPPEMAYRTGIGSIGFVPAPSSGTIYVQGARLPDVLRTGTDRSGLPRLFNEALCLGAAIRACRHDIGQSEAAMRLPLLGAELQDKTRRLRYLLAKANPTRAGFVVADGLEWQMPGGRG